MTPREQELTDALEAIRARIDGEWDNPALKKYGPMRASGYEDVRYIANAALRKDTK